MTDKTPKVAADTAAEAIRALNHRTLSHGVSPDWEYPSDAYDVVGNLSRMAMMLPQAIDQTRALVERLSALDSVRSDRGTLDDDLAATFGGLDEARKAAEALYAGLNRAHSGLSPLAYQD